MRLSVVRVQYTPKKYTLHPLAAPFPIYYYEDRTVVIDDGKEYYINEIPGGTRLQTAFYSHGRFWIINYLHRFTILSSDLRAGCTSELTDIGTCISVDCREMYMQRIIHDDNVTFITVLTNSAIVDLRINW